MLLSSELIAPDVLNRMIFLTDLLWIYEISAEQMNMVHVSTERVNTDKNFKI